MRRLLLLLPALAFAFPLTRAHADARRICNGRVYYTPCPPNTVEGIPARSGKRTFRAQTEKPRVEIKRGARPVLILRERRVTLHPKMEIINPVMDDLGDGHGLWWGYVRGNGKIHLTLKILEHGRVVREHYMGNVSMKPGEEQVKFRYRAPLPASKGWTWKVVGRLT